MPTDRPLTPTTRPCATRPWAPRRAAATAGALLLAVVATTSAALGLGLSPAAAHASLTASDPEEGAVLQTAPEQVSLTFSEDVSAPAYVAVTTPDGTDLADGRPRIDGAGVVQPLATPEQAGTYTLAYRVVSADGHPIEGELSFDVRRVAEPSPTADPSADPSTGSGADTGQGSSEEQPARSGADAAPASQTTDDGFWSQYGVVTGIGVAAALLVAGLLLLSRRRAQSGR